MGEVTRVFCQTQSRIPAVDKLARHIKPGRRQTFPTFGGAGQNEAVPAHPGLSGVGRMLRKVIRDHPPHFVAHVVGHQNSTFGVHDNAQGPPHRIAITVQKPCQDVLRWPCRNAFGERHENYLVSRRGAAVPQCVLADERTAAVLTGKQSAGVERQPQRPRMRPRPIVGHNRPSPPDRGVEVWRAYLQSARNSL